MEASRRFLNFGLMLCHSFIECALISGFCKISRLRPRARQGAMQLRVHLTPDARLPLGYRFFHFWKSGFARVLLHFWKSGFARVLLHFWKSGFGCVLLHFFKSGKVK
jgi:hypothetical protein